MILTRSECKARRRRRTRAAETALDQKVTIRPGDAAAGLEQRDDVSQSLEPDVEGAHGHGDQPHIDEVVCALKL